jgi:hypothetical protein
LVLQVPKALLVLLEQVLLVLLAYKARSVVLAHKDSRALLVCEVLQEPKDQQAKLEQLVLKAQQELLEQEQLVLLVLVLLVPQELKAQQVLLGRDLLAQLARLVLPEQLVLQARLVPLAPEQLVLKGQPEPLDLREL